MELPTFDARVEVWNHFNSRQANTPLLPLHLRPQIISRSPNTRSLVDSPSASNIPPKSALGLLC